MSEADLEEIRRARMQQLREQQGGSSMGGGGIPGLGGGGGGDAGQADEEKEQRQRQRDAILNQILHPEARDRLGRIRLVKESRATEVEDQMIALARAGRLRAKVTEAELKDFLERSSSGQGGGGSGSTLGGGGGGDRGKVVFSRRARGDEDLDELLDDL